MLGTLSAAIAFLHINRQLVAAAADTQGAELAILHTVAASGTKLHFRYGNLMALIKNTIKLIIDPTADTEAGGVFATAQAADA